MSLWRRSPHNSIKSKRKGLNGVILKVEEKHDVWTYQSTESNQSTSHSNVVSSPTLPQQEMDRPIYDVAIIGAGPAGLTLAANLVRFGIHVIVIDNRSESTITGRADSLQPKTVETFRQMRIADRLLLKGVKVHDMRFWASTRDTELHRVKRDVQFPCDQVDTLDPYLLNAHQGFVEDVLLKDMMERGYDVTRDLTFVDFQPAADTSLIDITCESNDTHKKRSFTAKFIVGCDGAHSNVRLRMGARQVGSGNGEVWGVLDGVLDTNFPDLYSKAVIHSRDAGTLLLLPRERNMTRVYVEIRSEVGELSSKLDLTEKYVMDRASEILEPYTINWKSLEWFGHYQISRKTSSKFADESCRIFLAGDAAHIHSPKSQGMNSSIHDSWNLAWKLNLAVRGLSLPELLDSYEDERRQVADVLVDYDCEELDVLIAGDPEAYTDNCLRHARLVSGYGADYAPNILNVFQKGSILGDLRVGSLPPPAKVTRFIDANPVDIQLDIPMLGQFRILFFTKSLLNSHGFLEAVSTHALTGTSVLGRATSSANQSYSSKPPMEARSDDFVRPERYTTISGLFTFAIVLQMSLDDLKIEDLPTLWRESKFTVYLDDVPHLDTKGMTCTEKWLGSCSGSEVDIVVLRPDGYVGTIFRARGSKENAIKACAHLDTYFGGFLDV